MSQSEDNNQAQTPETQAPAETGVIIQGPWQAEPSLETSPRKRYMILAAIATAGLLLFAELLGIFIEYRQGRTSEAALDKDKSDLKALMSRNKSLKKKLAAVEYKGVHIVVDTSKNILYLKRGREVVRQAVVSCGSGNVLTDPSGERNWTFDTPRGEFNIRSKVTDPTWIKPDWAFIEEGEKIPTRTADRAEDGVMGDYAMGFGKGFFIHGTLYTRLLGRNVTHGCIRVGDADLKEVFEKTPVGTPLVIF